MLSFKLTPFLLKMLNSYELKFNRFLRLFSKKIFSCFEILAKPEYFILSFKRYLGINWLF